jgi:hypothetical protein
MGIRVEEGGLNCLVRSKEGLSFEMTRLLWIISLSEEGKDERILKLSREAVWPVLLRC